MLKVAYAILKLYLKKDPLTFEHSKRVAWYARSMAKYLKLNNKQHDLLVSAALLHDLGKAKVPEHILYKQGKLTASEFDYIIKHPIYGEKLVESYPELTELCPIILCHHERVDGTGYPNGLNWSQIPEFSRLISVIDAYDSIIEYRPYQHPKAPVAAIQELNRCKGTQFDKKCVEEFIAWIMIQGVEAKNAYSFKKTI